MTTVTAKRVSHQCRIKERFSTARTNPTPERRHKSEPLEDSSQQKERPNCAQQIHCCGMAHLSGGWNGCENQK